GKLEPFARLHWVDLEHDVTVLAASTRLPDEPPVRLRLLADRLLVGDLRPAHVRLDLELPQQAVLDDLQVQLAHTGDDRLTRLLIRPDAERRVLGREPPERGAQLLLVRLRLRLDRDRDHRLR